MRDFLATFFTTFICGLILCILGIIVFYLKPNMKSSWVFLGLCLSLGGYMATGFEIMNSYLLVRFHYVITCLYPVAILHLALIFPDKKRILTRFPALEYLIYLPILLLVVGWQIYLFAFPGLLESTSAVSSILSYKFLGIRDPAIFTRCRGQFYHSRFSLYDQGSHHLCPSAGPDDSFWSVCRLPAAGHHSAVIPYFKGQPRLEYNAFFRHLLSGRHCVFHRQAQSFRCRYALSDGLSVM